MIDHIELSASVMCVDWLHAEADLDVLRALPIDTLHWDIIDGVFAPDFTMGSSIIQTILKKYGDHFRHEYHLMAVEPAKLFSSLSLKPTDRVIIHQEACRNLHRDLLSIRKLPAQVGVAISPATPVEVLEYVIEEVDLVLLMMVDPGYKGQPMIPQMLRKIGKLKAMIHGMGLKTNIAVDGHVSPNVAKEMVDEGANHLVLGSSGLFRSDMSMTSAFQQFKDSLHQTNGIKVVSASKRSEAA